MEDYIRFVKEDFQGQYQGVNEVLSKVHLMVTSPPYFAALLQRPLAVARLERIFGGDAKNYVCKDCGRKRNLTPSLVCKKCGKDFSKTQKNKIIAKKICGDCKYEMVGNKTKCKKCGSKNLINCPTCGECGGEVEMIDHSCECGSKNYTTKFRSVQVKSSRIESKNGRSKNTYAVDMKPRDLIKDEFHFYVWCLIDDEDKPHFLVISVEEFKRVMGDSLKGISFFKDQDRQHFSAKDFGKWKEFLNKFDKLE